MKVFMDVLYKVGKRIVLWLAAAILLGFGLIALVEQSYILQDADEACLFLRNGWCHYLLILLGAAALFLLRKPLSGVDSRLLFGVLGLVYLGMGIYLIGNVDAVLRADAAWTLDCAKAFQNGDFSSLTTGNYLFLCRHQLGLATFERFLLLFGDRVEFFFFFNLAMVLLINFFQWRITKLLFGEHPLIINYAILISFAFLPQFFFILFVYGLVPGFCAMMASVYFWIRFMQKAGVRDAVLGVFFILLACLIRNNYVIAAIAMFLLGVLKALKEKCPRGLLVGLAMLLGAALLPRALDGWYHLESDVEFQEGTPILLWLVMGLQDEEGVPSVGGWYNGYVVDMFREKGYDRDLATAQGIADLKGRLRELAGHPADAARFFGKKVLSTWGDPMFESVWSGPLEAGGQYTHTRFLRNLYTGEGVYRALAGIMDAFLFFIYLMAFGFLTKAGRGKELSCEELFPYLYLIGGVLFHLVWETKSQYVYPYVFCLFPYVAVTVKRFGDDTEQYLREKDFFGRKLLKNLEISDK